MPKGAGSQGALEAARDWLRLACEGPVVRRGLRYADVVGAILITINHGDALWRGDVEAGRLLKSTDINWEDVETSSVCICVGKRLLRSIGGTHPRVRRARRSGRRPIYSCANKL